MALSFMNITEKILARASEKNTVSPDDIVFAKVDKVMVHDVSRYGVFESFLINYKNKELIHQKYMIPQKFGLLKIILFHLQKKFLQKIL